MVGINGGQVSDHNWLLGSNEPWTRYRTRLDVLGQDENDPEVIQDRREMVSHPLVEEMIKKAQNWPGYALKRHNDANHPIQTLTVLADFGLRNSDPGIDEVVRKIKTHQSPEGAFETRMELYKSFSGLEGEHWVWMSCDAPVLVYAMTAFGEGDDPSLTLARDHLLSMASDNGWRCQVSAGLGKFRGPGKKEDPCPIANLQVLKAFSRDRQLSSNPRIISGIDVILNHWSSREEKKYYLFGMGTDFKKIKYPFIWYDVLHVVDVLSCYPHAVKDYRFEEMVRTILDQGDDQGRYSASSMYMAWKGWSFADKKQPSPWLTFLVRRIGKRIDWQGHD